MVVLMAPPGWLCENSFLDCTVPGGPRSDLAVRSQHLAPDGEGCGPRARQGRGRGRSVGVVPGPDGSGARRDTDAARESAAAAAACGAGVRANDVVASDRLVDVLWGDEPPPQRGPYACRRSCRVCATTWDRSGSRPVAPGYVLRIERNALEHAEVRGSGARRARAPRIGPVRRRGLRGGRCVVARTAVCRVRGRRVRGASGGGAPRGGRSCAVEGHAARVGGVRPGRRGDRESRGRDESRNRSADRLRAV